MTLVEFVNALKASVPAGSVLDNPGGGTSKIVEYSQSFVTYRRGKSNIRVSYKSLFKAYAAFRGRQVSSSELKLFAPSVFDSAARPAGHSCNATFLFLLLGEIGMASGISGRGVKGDPYFVAIR
jgi:hypothetical protein